MKLLPRDTETLTGLAGGLSLVWANYKPIPELPTNASISAAKSKNGNSLMPLGAHSFKTEPANYTSPHADESLWGQASVLYIPDDDSDSASASSSSSSAKKLASGKTVGPGNCPLNTADYGPSASLPDPVFPAFDSVKANIMRYRQQVGTNLGAWFVQEGWMQTSFMKCAQLDGGSELALLTGFGKTDNGIKSAKAYLEQHWDTWITEDDFKYIASKGMNTVRIPIGYWSVGPYFITGTEFEPWKDVYEKSWTYIGRAINWAAKYDIGVIIDLHGAYGSQNGNDHSGRSGSIDFFTKANQQKTTDLLKWIANEISDVTNVVGIEVLNEPKDRDSLWTWYTSVMNDIRGINEYTKTVPLYFHDAFNMAKGAKFVSGRDDFVVQDNHAYYVYTASDTATSAAGHTKKIEGSILQQFQRNSATGRRNMIVGEWSCALAPSSLASSSNPDQDNRNYCIAQTETYQNATAGYTFWSYKMENCNSNSGWCMRKALGTNLPQYLNAWGFSGYTINRKVLLNLESAKATSKAIVSGIASLIVPGSNTTSASLRKVTNGASRVAAASFAVSNAANKTAAKTITLASVGTKIAPLLDGDGDDKASNHDAGRVGMVVSTSNSRRGVGSVAARAGAASRSLQGRADGTVLNAQQAGFSDGYLSVTYFASAFSESTPLSRLGFGEQYMMDSWAKRVSWDSSTWSKDDYGHYRTHFNNGATTAEAAVVGAVNAAPVAG
ncbi:unnamed protein product [Sympodiomycopsis kandeliae]